VLSCMSKITVRSTPESIYRATTANYVLHPDEVEIWQASNDVEAEFYDPLRKLLSPEEVHRAAAFRFERHRQQYVIGHGLLRTLLASYLHTDPCALRFHYTAKGKPELLFSDKELRVQFNMAHSGANILLGFTLDRKIGVDVEEIRSDIEIDDISQRFFSPTERRWLASCPLPQRYHAFFRCWTRKEALLKGTGEGLSVSLDSFDVFSDGNQDRCWLETADERKWLVQDVELARNYAAAVAVGYADVDEFRMFPRTSLA
jgi:4'-phosphopantetheinyl transferase